MLSIPHLIIIFVVALVVFGPDKLPDLARNLGKIMGEFKRATNDLRSTFEGHLRDLEKEADQRRIGGGPASTTPPMMTAAPPTPGTIPASPPNLFTGAPEDEFPTPPPAPESGVAEGSAPESKTLESAAPSVSSDGAAVHDAPIPEHPEPVSDGRHHSA